MFCICWLNEAILYMLLLSQSGFLSVEVQSIYIFFFFCRGGALVRRSTRQQLKLNERVQLGNERRHS